MIDYAKIRKEFKKLKCPRDVWTPLRVPFETCPHDVIMSNRTRGKTTNCLLWELLLKKHYGISGAYIRPTADSIQAKKIRNLFMTIENYNYIEKIFGDRWNGVYYFSQAYYLCKKDEEQKIIEKDTKPFLYLFSVDNAEHYKSTFADNTTDFIIYDEFIRSIYPQDEFIKFMDLLSTIRRNRETTRVIWLANCTDLFSTYFRELCISKQIATMSEGDSQIIQVPEGARVYVEIISSIANEKTIALNKFFYGFPNKKLQSIVGGGFAIPLYPHIVKGEKDILARNIYVNYNGNLINLKLCYTDDLGFHVDCTPAKRTYDDSYIYTNGTIEKSIDHYRLGRGNEIDRRIWGLFRENRFYFSDNTTGAMLNAYYKESYL